MNVVTEIKTSFDKIGVVSPTAPQIKGGVQMDKICYHNYLELQKTNSMLPFVWLTGSRHIWSKKPRPDKKQFFRITRSKNPAGEAYTLYNGISLSCWVYTLPREESEETGMGGIAYAIFYGKISA